MTDKELIISYIVNASNGLGKAVREAEILIIIAIIIGIAILWNQRKIRKQLQQIKEQLDQKEL